jgi:hypothetical protein
LSNALHIAYNKSSQDAGGMIISQRSSTIEETYRYGFNGMEKDDEIKGEGFMIRELIDGSVEIH